MYLESKTLPEASQGLIDDRPGTGDLYSFHDAYQGRVDYFVVKQFPDFKNIRRFKLAPYLNIDIDRENDEKALSVPGTTH